MSKVLLMLLIIMFVGLVLMVTSSRSHEYGHAERCYVANVEQNKVLLYIDGDGDNIVEECATIWVEQCMQSRRF